MGKFADMAAVAALSLAISNPVLAAAPAKAPAPASAPANVAAASPKCEVLAAQWRSFEVSLAKNAADALGDDSAPRATMRAGQDGAIFTQAAITLRLMELNHCPLPAAAPSSATFMIPALDCKLARMKASLDELKAGLPACDNTKWVAAQKQS